MRTTSPKTIQKYINVLNDIVKQKTLTTKDIRAITQKHRASNAIETYMVRVGQLSRRSHGVYNVNVKDVTPRDARILIDYMNESLHKQKTHRKQTLKTEPSNESFYIFLERRIDEVEKRLKEQQWFLSSIKVNVRKRPIKSRIKSAWNKAISKLIINQ